MGDPSFVPSIEIPTEKKDERIQKQEQTEKDNEEEKSKLKEDRPAKPRRRSIE